MTILNKALSKFGLMSMAEHERILQKLDNESFDAWNKATSDEIASLKRGMADQAASIEKLMPDAHKWRDRQRRERERGERRKAERA